MKDTEAQNAITGGALARGETIDDEGEE